MEWLCVYTCTRVYVHVHTYCVGPVRRFMEMVVTGLSKNPYYTVKEKHQQIQWYKKYFSKFSPEDLQGAALGVDFHPTNPEKEYQGKSEPRKTDKKKRTSSSK